MSPVHLLEKIIFQGWRDLEASGAFIVEGVYEWADSNSRALALDYTSGIDRTPKDLIKDASLPRGFWYFDNINLICENKDGENTDLKWTRRLLRILNALSNHPLKRNAGGPPNVFEAFQFAEMILYGYSRDDLLLTKEQCIDVLKDCPHFFGRCCATNIFIGLFLTRDEIQQNVQADGTTISSLAVDLWAERNKRWMIDSMMVNAVVRRPERVDETIVLADLERRIKTLLE